MSNQPPKAQPRRAARKLRPIVGIQAFLFSDAGGLGISTRPTKQAGDEDLYPRSPDPEVDDGPFDPDCDMGSYNDFGDS